MIFGWLFGAAIVGVQLWACAAVACDLWRMRLPMPEREPETVGEWLS